MLGDTLTSSLWITTVTTDDLFPFALVLVVMMTASDSLGLISLPALRTHRRAYYELTIWPVSQVPPHPIHLLISLSNHTRIHSAVHKDGIYDRLE